MLREVISAVDFCSVTCAPSQSLGSSCRDQQLRLLGVGGMGRAVGLHPEFHSCCLRLQKPLLAPLELVA